ncbi:hypothetical protein BDQ17DRAFT_1425185 [Cyathus striatus]|nr:hypothetical protein BDQ17DRAFT_1425185 [Cyathus striatus]
MNSALLGTLFQQNKATSFAPAPSCPPLLSSAAIPFELMPATDYVGPLVYQKDPMYASPPPGVSTGLGYLGSRSGAVMPIKAINWNADLEDRLLPRVRERERGRLRKKCLAVAAGPGVFELSKVDSEEGKAGSISRPRTPPRPAAVEPVPVTLPKAGVGEVQSAPLWGLSSWTGSVKWKTAISPPRPHPSASSLPPSQYHSLRRPTRHQPSTSPSPAHTHAPPTSCFFRAQATNTIPRPVTGIRSGSMADLSLCQNQQYGSDSRLISKQTSQAEESGIRTVAEGAGREACFDIGPSAICDCRAVWWDWDWAEVPFEGKREGGGGEDICFGS